MRLIKSVSLVRRQGQTERVYEVELCEVGPQRFVVNFRHGRRGDVLQEGTRTTVPVPQEQAERVFDDLVRVQRSAGYHEPDEPLSTASAPAPGAAPIGSRHKQSLLKKLEQARADRNQTGLSRVVWRIGELRLREAEPLLLELIGQGFGSGKGMLDYCIAWSLGQCGSETSLPKLEALRGDAHRPPTVRRIATEALRQLRGGEAMRRELLAELPPSLAVLAERGPSDALAAALRAHLDGSGHAAYEVLETLYRIDDEHVRPALLDVLRTAPLKPPWFQRIRHLFKTAEMRRDAEMLGLLAHRFETERANFLAKADYVYERYLRQPKPTVGPDATAAFSTQTRLYLRRRTWRTLRRLGEVNDPAYAALAVGVLLPFTDADARQPLQEVRATWNRTTRRYDSQRLFWDRYSRFWGFNQILYRNSPRYEPEPGRKGFRCVEGHEPGGPVPEDREEAFPHLWDKAPARLMQLLFESRCEPVHGFAVRAVRHNGAFCARLEIADLIRLLAAPYEITAEFGFELATARYDAANPDKDLVVALANCALPRGRQQAREWISAQPGVFLADTHVVVALAGSPHGDTRLFLRESLRGVSLPEPQQRQIVSRLVALLLSIGAGESERAADVTATLRELFAEPLRTIGPDVIRDLLASPLVEVQRFAGDLVLNHQTLAQHPPEDVLRALLGAEDATVREIGVRIIARLPDDVLRNSIELLVALTRHPLEDIRAEIRPTVKRLAESDPAFGRLIAEMLLDALLIPGAPEGVPGHTSRVLRDDLRLFLSEVPAATVIKLLRSRSQPAQEVGGVLLATNVSPGELSIEELVRLADHEILAVRESARQMLAQDVEQLRESVAVAVRLLDAKWDDTRQWAFALFRERFTETDFTPETLVGVCDSIRPDVQQFGRQMITRMFQSAHGPEYVVKLSEHPTPQMQLFATNFLAEHAAGDVERLQSLTPYFLSVLSRVNKSRVAKDRLLHFLGQEAMRDEVFARSVAEILARQSATCAIGDRATLIEMMLRIHETYPEIELPIEIRPIEFRA